MPNNFRRKCIIETQVVVGSLTGFLGNRRGKCASAWNPRITTVVNGVILSGNWGIRTQDTAKRREEGVSVEDNVHIGN